MSEASERLGELEAAIAEAMECIESQAYFAAYVALKRTDYCAAMIDQGKLTMSEKLPHILDTVTDKVLSYRPVDKGLAAKKTKRRLVRKMKQSSD